MTQPRRITVITGSRAEYGLLRPVMRAIRDHRSLQLETIVTGTHLLPPSLTIEEVQREFTVDATVIMQHEGKNGRVADAEAFGRGVAEFAGLFVSRDLRTAASDLRVVVVLGDRVEAFAAASAAAIAGVRVAHIHGGDRAEGIADESMRHAITKLAHLHFPATKNSAERIVRMGEDPARVYPVGSPAVDDLRDIPPLDDAAYDSLGRPEIVFLLHPSATPEHCQRKLATELLATSQSCGRTLAIAPNYDAGRDVIISAIRASGVTHLEHLPREMFIGLLRRVKMIVGNSSAGLIECAALGVRCVNVGSRQNGREKPDNVVDVSETKHLDQTIATAIDKTSSLDHPYGEGASGSRTAEVLATFDPVTHTVIKRNTY